MDLDSPFHQRNFSFQYANYGIWKVTYISQKTGERWSAGVSDLDLIERTKNARFPKETDLMKLGRLCKGINPKRKRTKKINNNEDI